METYIITHLYIWLTIHFYMFVMKTVEMLSEWEKNGYGEIKGNWEKEKENACVFLCMCAPVCVHKYMCVWGHVCACACVCLHVQRDVEEIGEQWASQSQRRFFPNTSKVVFSVMSGVYLVNNLLIIIAMSFLLHTDYKATSKSFETISSNLTWRLSRFSSTW